MGKAAVISDDEWDQAFDAFEAGATLEDLARQLKTDAGGIGATLKAMNATRYARCKQRKLANGGRAAAKVCRGKPRQKRAKRWEPITRIPGPFVPAPRVDTDEASKRYACRKTEEFSPAELAAMTKRLQERLAWVRA